MVNKYSLDKKLKEMENAVVLNEIKDARRFVKYFVNLMENILNYEYDDLKSYFEEDKTEIEIKIVEKQYELGSGGVSKCWISAFVKLHRDDYTYPKLKIVRFKIADKIFNHIMDIDNFIYGSEDDENFIVDYLKIIKSCIFKDFKYDWSYNKDKIFKRYIKNKNITPSQYIIGCINNYIYNYIIKPKSKIMTYDEFINSEFKFEVDKKTQQIFNNYFFDNI